MILAMHMIGDEGKGGVTEAGDAESGSLL